MTPKQHQKRQPGLQEEMRPHPRSERPELPSCNRLKGRVVLITGGDSGIGRAVAIGAAREGADVAIVYLNEREDAENACAMVEERGRHAMAIEGDAGDATFAKGAVAKVIDRFGRLDILVNNAGEQHVQEKPEEITPQQLERTFRTNIFAQFFMVQAALAHMKQGGAIVNITSVTAYKGNPVLIDYSATKGAIVSYTRSLSGAVVDRGIRVNAVAPGPIWTPLIPASYPADKVEKFGQDTPMKRPGQPDEVAAAVIFLASDEASYITGQTLHVNGGEIVNA